MTTASEPYLTAREIQILYLSSKGLSAKDIGKKQTVQNQRRSILIKLNARNITHAVAIAISRGII